MKVIGWTWTSLKMAASETNQVIDMASVGKAEWHHTVRNSVRMHLWKREADMRRDMQGIQVGIDRKSSLACFRKTSDQNKGVLRSILSGAFWTIERLSRTNVFASPVCLSAKRVTPRMNRTCGGTAPRGTTYATGTHGQCRPTCRAAVHLAYSAVC